MKNDRRQIRSPVLRDGRRKSFRDIWDIVLAIVAIGGVIAVGRPEVLSAVLAVILNR